MTKTGIKRLGSIVKDNRIDFRELVQHQRVHHKVGTDSYKRYESYWEQAEKLEYGTSLGDSTIDTRGRTRLTEPAELKQEVEDETIQEMTPYECFNSGESDDVWVGIKFEEDETHYTLRDLEGNSIKSEDFITIKSNDERYEQFEMKCWSDFIGNEIDTKEDLYHEISGMIDVPITRIKDTRVDSDYDTTKEDVVISFKVKVQKK